MTAPPLIFVCDDSPTVLEVMSQFLGDAGFMTRRFAGSRGLVALLPLRTPAAIVLDISMPDADAFDLLRCGALPVDIPIVFVSSKQAYLDAARLENEKRWPERRFRCCDKAKLKELPALVASLLGETSP